MAEAADQWVDVPTGAPLPKNDGWTDVPPAQQPVSVAAMPAIKAHVEPILNAMGQGFREGWGPDRLGLPDEDVKALSKAGIFAPPGADHYSNPFHAFNELLAETVYRTGQIAARGTSALFRAGQAGVAAIGEEAGQPQLGRDIAAMPEAFFGSPHPTGMARPLEAADVHFAPIKDAVDVSAAPEKISAAALRSPDGKVFTGLNHGEAFSEAAKVGQSGNATESGFITDSGRFVTREEALKIAGDADQIKRESQLKYKDGLVAEQTDLREARDLGVIGPEPKPAATPIEAAEQAVPRVMAAEGPKDDTIKSAPINAARDKAGNIRLDQIGINADAKDVMLEAAKTNDDFNVARHGDIPLAQVSSLSDASGIPAKELAANDGLGRLMHNDAVVRTWLQAFHQASDDIAAKMKEVSLNPTDTAVEELRDMKLRFAHMQEQVSGLTAEAGRTLGVFREFYEAKGKAEALGKVLEDNPGNDIDSLKKMAKAGAGLDDPAQVAKFLNDARKPNFWDKAIFYWVNALISGPITHTKYVIANAAFAGYEAGVVTPVASALGVARKAFGVGAEDRVLMGEPAARLWGLVAGTPDAFVAAYKAARTGLQTPLPGELAQSILPKQNKNVFFQQRPIPGTLGAIIGIPSRGASAIHSFFNFLGYRAELEQQAYRAAVKEGLSPRDDGFWQRRASIADNPSKEMMDKAIEEGYRLTFLTELGPTAKKVSSAINSYPPFRLIMPFVHIPFNILKSATDNTAIGLFREDVRNDVLGKNGVEKQDRAIARVVAGSAIGGWIMNQVVNDNVTGYGPTDQKERALWLLTHQPYSIRIGQNWINYNRFGPLGTLIGLHANFGEILPHIKWDGEEATKAAALLVHSTGRMIEDEVGMQGLAGLMDSINEPERKGTRFMSAFAASWLPFSSGMRQTASFMDPEMREAKTFLDGIKYAVPGVREGLLPKRDWTGTPVENPSYHSVIRAGTARRDPLDLEMQTLNIKPTPPSNRIHGVKLTPELYDKYQSTAGPFTKTALDSMVNQPSWHDLPPFVRENTIRATIKSTREAAAAMMQAGHPEIIQQGVADRLSRIRGEKPARKLAQ